MLLDPQTFKGRKPGKKLLILGAVHGKEVCGPEAINRVISEIRKGSINIECGSVTFVPICNPKAFEKGERYIDCNLNRFLGHPEDPDFYETRIGEELCPLLDECDVLLDLHSYTAGGAPFVFIDTSAKEEKRFAKCLGAAIFLTGWQKAYANSTKRQKKPKSYESMGTTEYARQHGAIAVTFECGQHKDPASVDFAYRAILNALHFLNLCPVSLNGTRLQKNVPLIELQQVIWRGKGGEFTRDLQQMQLIAANEVVAHHKNGRKISVPYDAHIIMPHADAPSGEEWFYFGRKIQEAQPC